jgi:hypothetical protein
MFRPDFETFCAGAVPVDKNRFVAVLVQVEEAASFTRHGARRRYRLERHVVLLHSKVGQRRVRLRRAGAIVGLR